MKNIPDVFSASPYGPLEKVTDIISKARVKIFYAGLNRNFTFITSEFADKLLRSLPGVPVGGLWDDEEEDFTDHGTGDRQEFRAFGFVPEWPNVKWESFVDDDGVRRDYACCDVYLWTDRWEAARNIVGKKQSMEIRLASIKGKWVKENGIEYYLYEDGVFSGLTALGGGVEPCFEGSGFYSLKTEDITEIKSMIECVKQFTQSLDAKICKGGLTMQKPIIEPVVDPVADPVVDPVADPVVDPTVEIVVEPTEDPVIEPTEDPAIEPIEPTDPVVEPAANPVEPVVEPVAEPTDPVVEPAVDYEATINDLTDKLQQSTELYTAAQQEIATLKAERDNLLTFKLSIENKDKEDFINKYSKMLNETQKSELLEQVSTYSMEELKTKIALILFDNSVVPAEPTSTPVIFKLNEDEDNNLSGAARLMKKYSK